MTDPFASGPIGITLAWLATSGMLIYATVSLFTILFAKDDIARPFKIWLTLCLLFLAPVRYVVFLAIAGASFPWHSVSAFINSFILALYIPVVFGLLFFVGVPVSTVYSVRGTKRRTEIRWGGAGDWRRLGCRTLV